MTAQSETIAEFWQVFQDHRSELAAISSADHPVYDLILGQLQRIHPELYFEFSTGSEGSELIVTAEGNRSLFSLVEAIVDAAPDVPGWTVVALKPKLGFPVRVAWEGTTVAIADVVFDPLEREGSDDLGLCLYVRGLAEDSADAAHNALLRALDHGLGERQFAESVQFTKVVPLPEGSSAEEHIPLTDLEAYINWRDRRRSAFEADSRATEEERRAEDDEVIRLLRAAATELGVVFASPYCVTDWAGTRHSYLGHFPHFGSENGLLIACNHCPEGNLREKEYALSLLGSDAVREPEDVRDLLRDWGWYGPVTDRPPWVQGRDE